MSEPPQKPDEIRCILVEQWQLIDGVTLRTVCAHLILLAVAGATLLAPLALMLYLLSWWGCR